MKRIFFVACFACFSFFFSLKASAYQSSTPIDLKGGLIGSGTVRTPSSLIEAYLNAISVDVVFNCDLGDLTVEVIDQTGETVFKTTVNAISGGTLPIDTSGWASGNYLLMIMDEQGGYLEGDFQID